MKRLILCVVLSFASVPVWAQLADIDITGQTRFTDALAIGAIESVSSMLVAVPPRPPTTPSLSLQQVII